MEWLLCVPLAALMAIPFVMLWPMLKTLPAGWRKSGEHIELFAWLKEEYGKQSFQYQAARGVVMGFEYMTAADAATLRGMIDIAPRRVANDLREILRDYEAWKAAK
jgi:hypothetical protein